MGGQLIELGARERHVQVLRTGRVRRDVRQVDVRARHAGQLDLRLLGSFLQALHGHAVAREVDAFALLELLHEVVGDALVKVIAAEAVVAGRGQHFDDAVADLQHGDVERAAAEVVDHDLLVGLLIEAVGQRGRRRLVDDTLDVEAGNLAGVLRRLALRVGEVGRHGDDGFGHGLAEIGFRIGFQLLQDHGADLLRGVLLAVDLDFIIRAHLALDRADRAVRVRDGLTLCHLADHALAGLGERDDGRGGAMTFRVGDNGRFAALHDGDAAIGSAKVDTDNFTHNDFLLY